MKISQAFPSKYLSAADLQGQIVPVSISHITKEDIGGDDKLVLYFAGKEKGLVLNKTNAVFISQLYGDDTTYWQGNVLELYDIHTEYQGKPVQGLRVRAPQQQMQQQQQQQPPQQNAQASLNQAPAGNSDGFDQTINDEIPF